MRTQSCSQLDHVEAGETLWKHAPTLPQREQIAAWHIFLHYTYSIAADYSLDYN